MSNEEPGKFGLQEFITQVKRELTAAVDAREKNNEPGTLKLKRLTLEINFIITEKAGAGFEVKPLVFTLGVNADRQSEKSHKVTLEIEPHDPTPPGTPVSTSFGTVRYNPVRPIPGRRSGIEILRHSGYDFLRKGEAEGGTSFPSPEV